MSESTTRSRRSLLAAAAGGLGAVAAEAVARPLAARAQASYVVLGGNNTETTTTAITNDSGNDPLLRVESIYSGGSTGSGTGLTATSHGGDGVQAVSVAGSGVVGGSQTGSGVRGYSSTGAGVYGHSIHSDGVKGYATSDDTTGVYGQNTVCGPGVVGSSQTGHGVRGISSMGVGVQGYTTEGAIAMVGHGYLGASGVLGYSGQDPEPTVPAKTGVIGVASEDATAVGVRGISATGRGGVFQGAAAQLRLKPSATSSHPTSGQAGDLFVDKSKRLWFCKGGTTWKQIA